MQYRVEDTGDILQSRFNNSLQLKCRCYSLLQVFPSKHPAFDLCCIFPAFFALTLKLIDLINIFQSWKIRYIYTINCPLI